MSILLFWLLLPALTQAVIASPRTEAQLAFQRLETLTGEWRSLDAPGGVIRVSYKLIANGHALVESWDMGRGRTSMTVYHRDGDTLLATHYCPLGNQPRLKFAPTATTDRIGFHFLDATNLSSPSDEHAYSFSFDLSGRDRVVRTEIYRRGEGAESSSLTLVRT